MYDSLSKKDGKEEEDKEKEDQAEKGRGVGNEADHDGNSI